MFDAEITLARSNILKVRKYSNNEDIRVLLTIALKELNRIRDLSAYDTDPEILASLAEQYTDRAVAMLDAACEMVSDNEVLHGRLAQSLDSIFKFYKPQGVA